MTHSIARSLDSSGARGGGVSGEWERGISRSISCVTGKAGIAGKGWKAGEVWMEEGLPAGRTREGDGEWGDRLGGH